MQDTDSLTATDTSTDQDSRNHYWTGANTKDSSSDASTDSFGEQDAVTATDTNTDTTTDVYTLYEAGSFGGGSYSLSSYSLLEQTSETTSIRDVTHDASADSGSWSDDLVIDGYTMFNGSETFANSTTSTDTVVETSTLSFTLSEQGTFGGGSFSLGSYAFSEQQSSSASMSDTGSSSDSFSGSNAGQSYSGTGSGSLNQQEVTSSSGTLSEQGSYANGSFTLSSIVYQGSGSDSFSGTTTQADSWSGSYSGSDSGTNADSGNGSYTDSATGNYSAGSFSLSTYSLTGGSSGSYSSSQGQQQTLNGAASSWSRTATGEESDNLVQAGTMAAGVYGNTSYNYTDNASDTTSNTNGGPGYLTNDTWSDSHSVQETGTGTSGSENETATSTYGYLEQGIGATGNNSMQSTPAATLPGAVVSPAAPDASSVPAAVTGAQTDGSVAVAPGLAVVGSTQGWLANTNSAAWQSAGQSTNTAKEGGAGGSIVGPQAAAGPAKGGPVSGAGFVGTQYVANGATAASTNGAQTPLVPAMSARGAGEIGVRSFFRPHAAGKMI
jgi:hypothetical protein